jgi:hypothetical protein
MSHVTLRIYFRNIMLFVHRDHGTDVWFVADHTPVLATATECLGFQGRVVRILGAGKPLRNAKTVVSGGSLMASFNQLAPGFTLHPDVESGTISDGLTGRVELRGGGTLTALPTVHRYGLTHWSIPVARSGEAPRVQRLTELAMYEVEHVERPVTLELGETSIRIDDEQSNVAEACFIAGEQPKPPAAPEASVVICEFGLLYACFDPDTQNALRTHDVLPRVVRPSGIPALSAEPYCPNAQVDVPSNPA